MGKYMIGLLVNNKYGVLSRISALFAKRGFNIDSLAVGETDNPDISRMTITIAGNEHDRDQIIKQLGKLHDVLHVGEMKMGESVCRELVLLKVSADKSNRQEIMDAANVFRNKIIDYSPRSITLEITGETGKLEAFIELMKEYGILEMCRTGIVSLKRGDECLAQFAKEEDEAVEI
ncbi:MAG: acetolactate synthase small subunit [Lachnospiraceae bacterium]|nr:acetolactate synthase small subunit [Lachnospiraceae bacterium]